VDPGREDEEQRRDEQIERRIADRDVPFDRSAGVGFPTLPA
jgi:hypothetical protein